MPANRTLDLTNNGQLRFFEARANGLSSLTLKGPVSLSADFTVTLPTALPPLGSEVVKLSAGGVLATVPDGSAGNVLTTNGAGGISWAPAAPSGAQNLQEAYNGGRTIILAPNAPVALMQAGAGGSLTVTDNGSGAGLLISHSSSGTGLTVSHTGSGVAVSLSHNSSGDGVTLSHSGAGVGINIAHSGSGAALKVVRTGAGTLSLTIDTGVALFGTALHADITAVAGTNPAIVTQRNSPNFGIVNVADGTAEGAIFAGLKTRNSNMSADTAVILDDTMLSLVGYGADGADYLPAAQILFRVDGAVVAGNVPSRISFRTTNVGTGGLNTGAHVFYKLDALTDFFATGPALTTSGSPVQFDANLGKGYAFGTYKGSGAQASLLVQSDVFNLNATRTFACWFYATSTSGSPPIFDNWQVSSSVVQYLCWIDSGSLKWQVRDGGSVDHVASVASPSLNAWHLVICTYNSATGDIVILLDDSSTATANTPSVVGGVGNSWIGIGTRNNNGGILNGAVSAFGMWTRVLTAAEKTVLWNGGLGIEPPFATPTIPVERVLIDNHGTVFMTATEDVNLLTLTKSGTNTGDVIRITNSGTGFDVRGNAGNWTIDKSGNAVFATMKGTFLAGGTFWPPDDTIRVIATGVVTIANNATLFKVDTEGGAGTDDLDNIEGGTSGQVIVLQTANNARDVQIRNNTGAGTKIQLQAGANFTLDHTLDRLVLMYDAGNAQWVELTRSNNG